jgi:hypothetical protein
MRCQFLALSFAIKQTYRVEVSVANPTSFCNIAKASAIRCNVNHGIQSVHNVTNLI